MFLIPLTSQIILSRCIVEILNELVLPCAKECLNLHLREHEGPEKLPEQR